MQRFASEKTPKIITKMLIVFLKTCIADRKGKIEGEGERLRDSLLKVNWSTTMQTLDVMSL